MWVAYLGMALVYSVALLCGTYLILQGLVWQGFVVIVLGLIPELKSRSGD